MQEANQLITLPMRSVNKLRCTLCKECLSVPPVDITRKVCGRCNTSEVGCEAYEELAQYVLFPCIYSKCNEKIAWGKVKEHETKCLHKTFMCPVEGCTQVYEISSTNLHFLVYHKNLIFSDILKINPTNDRTKNKQVFLINGEHLLLVFAYGVPENQTTRYYFGVFALNSDYNNNTKFEVTLITYINSQLVSYTQKNQNIILFDERENCFKCIDGGNNRHGLLYYNTYNTCNTYNTINGSCPAKYYHKRKHFLPVNFNTVDMKNCRNVSYQIDIIHGERKTEKADNKELSKKMECPICTHYMVSPIYICDTGHSFCEDCKKKLSTCPYCQAHIGNKRNFVLEELAETIKVNCNNFKYGCKFFGELKLVKNHEDVCTHSEFDIYN